MKIVNLEKCKELLIYYKDYKYPSLYGIIQENPLILIDEDGITVFYPETIEKMIQWDRERYEDEIEFERYEISDKNK